MSTLVFDIETYAKPAEAQDAKMLEGLTKYCKTPEEREDALSKLGLNAATGEVACIAVLDPIRSRPAVFYRSDLNDGKTFELDSISWQGETLEVNALAKPDEATLIKDFWAALDKYNTIVTYNGRGFDCPFIMQRSLILGTPASRSLNSNRFHFKRHWDLCDYLSGFGASRRLSLDMLCRACGITSPKEDDIDGSQVSKCILNGDMQRVANYCMRDVVATAELAKRAHDTFATDIGDQVAF